MKCAYKYRFYPSPEQAELLTQTFGCVRFVYNSVLRWRSDAFKNRQKKIGYSDASAYLTSLKKSPDLVWLNDVS
ncbi:helix-turn-helix domain-containing protein, partial [Ewingella sp. AOP9-I1-14]